MITCKTLKSFNYHSLKLKIIISLLASFIIIIVTVISMNLLSSRMIKEKIYSSVESNILQTKSYLRFLMQNAENICFALSTNSNLEELSNYYKNSERNYFDIYKLRKDLSKDIMYQAEISGEIDSIYVNISNIQALITSKYVDFKYDEIKDYNITKEMENIVPPYIWTSFYDEDISNKKYISIICKAHQLRSSIKSPAYISVNYSEETICNIINSLKITPHSKVFLTDKKGKIISNEDKTLINTLLTDKINIDISKIEEHTFFKTKLDKESYFIIHENSPLIDWNILLFIPEDELLKELDVFQKNFIMLCLLALPALLYFMKKIVIKYIDEPVGKLVAFMKKVEQGNFDVRISDNRKDELGYLILSNNNMVEKLQRLIQELYQQKLLKKEMELKVLKKQIDPHFLYNTLDTVNWIAQAHRIDEISNIVLSLSNMYKTTFNRGRDLISCSDMTEGLQCYLAIQKIRYGNSFDYSIDVDSSIYDCVILNLLVQTIVENAVVHGIGDCRESRFIRICGRKEKDDVIFTVEDNGCGMSEEKLELLNLTLNNDKIKEDSGLKNVQKRVKLYYGEKYGITIESIFNKGTKVTLLVPYVKDIKNLEREKNYNDKYFSS
jgi:two-component system, sensor histidine kinase YesM